MSSSSEDPRIERTRVAAMEAALVLLRSDGIDAVTHARVSSESRVSRTTLYRHWPTRQDLLLATFETIGKPPAVEPSGDLRADLITAVNALAEHLRDEDSCRILISILERSRWDDAVAEVKSHLMARKNDVMMSILDAGLQSGELRSGLSTDLADEALKGTLFVRRFLTEQPIDEQLVERLVDEFLAANTADS